MSGYGRPPFNSTLLYKTPALALRKVIQYADPNSAEGTVQGNWFWGATGAVTHATTGALIGQGSAIAGSAARIGTHATTGILVGQSSAVTGSAARTRSHATSGVLTAQGSTVAGSAARTRTHATSGVLSAGDAIIVGSARRNVPHATSGVLTGPGALLDGAANHISLYPNPSDVRAGVQYGPGGIYTGTLTPEGGSTIIRLRSFTERH